MDEARKGLVGLPGLRPRLLIVVDQVRDRLALWELGFNATTNPMGVGDEWRDDYTQQLAGAGATWVIVILDDDLARRTRADIVARCCLAADLDVKVVPLPAANVSHWLSAGGTKDDLLALIEAAPPFTPATPSMTVAQFELWLNPLRGITPATALNDIVAALSTVRAQIPLQADRFARDTMSAMARSILEGTQAGPGMINAAFRKPRTPSKEEPPRRAWRRSR